MKKSILLLVGIICLCGTLFGCGNNHNREESNDDLPIQNSISSTEESLVIDNTPVVESESQSENSNLKGQILLLDSEVDSIALNNEELGNIQKIIESGTWNEETAECIDDCLISIDGMDYYYHRECGTINDKIHRRHMILNNEDKEMLNSIIVNCSDCFLWLCFRQFLGCAGLSGDAE